MDDLDIGDIVFDAVRDGEPVARPIIRTDAHQNYRATLAIEALDARAAKENSALRSISSESLDSAIPEV